MNTTQNLETSKFSIPSADIEPADMEVYAELENFVYHLAWSSDSPGNVLMEAEEITGELLLELVKGVKNPVYRLFPKEERKAVIRRMLDNRLGELKYRFFGTHRKAAKLSISLEAEEIAENVASSTPNPEQVMLSLERVGRTREKLSPVARQVFDTVVLGQNERLTQQLVMAVERAFNQFKNPTVRVKPWHVAEALMMDEATVVKAFTEIKKAYAEVCRG